MWMIILDIETSGSYPGDHGIVSLGALEFESPDNCFYEECRLESHHQIDPAALDINGFTETQCRDSKKKTIREMLTDFLEWMKAVREKTLAGLGPSDWAFLHHEFKQHNLPWPFSYRIIDLHSLVYAHHLQRQIPIPLANDVSHLTAIEIVNYCGIKGIEFPHHGFEDAKLEAECFYRLLYGKPMFAEYADQAIPEYLRRCLTIHLT